MHGEQALRFVGDLIAALDAPGLMRVDGSWWIEMSAGQKDGKMPIHFVNRSCAGCMAPNRHRVENVPEEILAGEPRARSHGQRNLKRFTLKPPLEEQPAIFLSP